MWRLCDGISCPGWAPAAPPPPPLYTIGSFQTVQQFNHWFWWNITNNLVKKKNSIYFSNRKSEKQNVITKHKIISHEKGFFDTWNKKEISNFQYLFFQLNFIVTCRHSRRGRGTSPWRPRHSRCSDRRPAVCATCTSAHRNSLDCSGTWRLF